MIHFDQKSKNETIDMRPIAIESDGDSLSNSVLSELYYVVRDFICYNIGSYNLSDSHELLLTPSQTVFPQPIVITDHNSIPRC